MTMRQTLTEMTQSTQWKDRIRSMRINDKFKRWWRNEGSGITPNPGEDQESHAHRVAEAAWKKATSK